MEVGKSKLLEAKLRRQETSHDALLLKNRIALLKAEEEKAWKKIEQTRKRANELRAIRDQNERDNAKLRTQANEIQLEIQRSNQNKHDMVQSFASIDKKREVQVQLTEARRLEALQLKEEKQKWREQLQAFRKENLDASLKRKINVKTHKAIVKERKLKQQEEMIKQMKQKELEKIQLEEEALAKQMEEVQKMENIEYEWLQRLRETQTLQKQAFEELEATLSGTTLNGQASEYGFQLCEVKSPRQLRESYTSGGDTCISPLKSGMRKSPS